MGSELDYGVIDGMGEHTEFRINGVCLELGFGEFLEMNVEDYVPLHPPPLQGSDVLALLMMVFEMGWYQIPQIICVEGLQDVSDKSPQYVLVCEHLLLVPRSYVRFHILPI